MYNAPARLLLVCILLCAQQRSAPAYVWQGTQRGQLSVSDYLPGSSPCPATPPASPRSKHDAAADLSHAEADETGQEKRGCCCQETGMCSPDTGLLRHQVGQEMHPELRQTQAQCKTCPLIHEP
ncbi:uncharacterized protein LOC144053990 isoform X1 [Vanacampus margaritifer]